MDSIFRLNERERGGGEQIEIKLQVLSLKKIHVSTKQPFFQKLLFILITVPQHVIRWVVDWD